MTRRWTTRIVLVGILVSLGAAGFAEVVDRIVAIVNDEVISLYELNKATQPYIEQVRNSQYPEDVERQLTFEVRSKILNELINEKLADQELKRQNISVSEKEVDSAIERIKESRAISDEELRKALVRAHEPHAAADPHPAAPDLGQPQNARIVDRTGSAKHVADRHEPSDLAPSDESRPDQPDRTEYRLRGRILRRASSSNRTRCRRRDLSENGPTDPLRD